MLSIFSFVLLSSAAFTARAVTINAYSAPGCIGNLMSCVNTVPFRCCRRLQPLAGFSSCFFQYAQDTEFGTIFSPTVSIIPQVNTVISACGIARNTVVGATCVEHPTLMGARGCTYINCIDILGCARNNGPLGNFDQISSRDPGAASGPGVNDYNCTSSQEPDKITFSDGHMFHVGNGTPSHHSAALFAHFDANSVMGDIQPELLQYEVNPEGVQHRQELLQDPNAHPGLTPNLGW